MVERGVDQLICLCERAVQGENNAGDRFHTEKIYQKVEGDTKIRGFFSPFSYIGVRNPTFGFTNWKSTMGINDIEKLLAGDAKPLLEHACKGIPKTSIC